MGMQTDNAPLDGRESTAQLIARINRELDRLQRDMHELSARVDSMVPGADIHQHHDDHVEIHETRVERRRMWSNLRSQALAGFVMAVLGGLFGVIGYAAVAWVKATGGG